MICKYYNVKIEKCQFYKWVIRNSFYPWPPLLPRGCATHDHQCRPSDPVSSLRNNHGPEDTPGPTSHYSITYNLDSLIDYSVILISRWHWVHNFFLVMAERMANIIDRWNWTRRDSNSHVFPVKPILNFKMFWSNKVYWLSNQCIDNSTWDADEKIKFTEMIDNPLYFTQH